MLICWLGLLECGNLVTFTINDLRSLRTYQTFLLKKEKKNLQTDQRFKVRKLLSWIQRPI
jgi:hypothetical protein